jgi:hypothetical protein
MMRRVEERVEIFGNSINLLKFIFDRETNCDEPKNSEVEVNPLGATETSGNSCMINVC